MSRPAYCACDAPRPRVVGVMRAVCENCGLEVGAKKKGGAFDANSATMTPEQVAAEVRQIRRIVHGLNNRLEKLDNALNAN